MTMGRDFAYWLSLTLGAPRGLSLFQATMIANRLLHAELNGAISSVWHETSEYLKQRPCHCARCATRRAA